MRIRNSRPSFPIPQAPQAVLRSNHLRSQFRHFDERFLVEEENRRIGWPYYPLRKHSSPDVQKVRPHDGLQSAIASKIKSSDFVEKKTGKENCMPAMQSHVSQKLEEPDKEGRTSNSSASSKRNVKGSRFSASVVLALPAPCTQPARGKKVYRTQKELPLKKRKKSRKLEVERTQAEKEEAATVKPDRTKEAFNKHDTSQVRTCINCLLNCESSPPHSSTYDSHGLQNEEDKLVETATLHGEKPNRKRGRPRKDSVHQSMATLGTSPF
ncbi:hypothetical protein NC652_000275 [Populus alba x Populus x berolinensis]|uniref:uncharacterized protein isoform X1 n=1 Tax=Populus alba TaxID=43335 RepID=UPI00158AAE7F|nr:uncharacterized protein LOC118049793 isoform X1 [Populus alba]KAJ6961312.1 hypothetical protein NC652_000275 [Populus alba x Populus x berolinensis]